MSKRTDAIEYRLGEIQGILLEAHHHNSGFIADQIKELTNLQITHKDFLVYTEKAIEIRQEILDKLKALLVKTLRKEDALSLEEIKEISNRDKIIQRAFGDRTSQVVYHI